MATEAENRERRLQQITRKCEHFNGTINARCKAGVAYASLEATPDGHGSLGLPCLDAPGAGPCEKRALLTREQAEVRLAAQDRSFEKLMEARRAIVADASLEKRGGRFTATKWGGAITCPECGKSLHYSIASSNGHVWGRCDTSNCLAWME